MNNEILIVLAVVLALGLAAVVAVQIVEIQQAEAAQPSFAKCPPGGVAFNASQGRCFRL